MSKIIVDQIQKNGGDVLTLPTNDATANNQPIVGSTTGVLSHSPLALPAADGAANRPVTTDGSGQLQFGSFSLPNSTGTNGQTLNSDGNGSAFWGSAAAPVPVHTNSDHIIGTVVTSTSQENSYSTGDWSSSAAYTTYRHDDFFSSANSTLQGWNMFLGDGYPDGTGQGMYANNHGYNQHRKKEFAANKRVGHSFKKFYYYDNQTSYAGLTWRCLPIRNGSASSINVTVYGYASSYTTYCSLSMGYYTPTYSSGTNYANVTGGSWTQLASYNSSDANRSLSGTVTVPAGTTVLVFLNSGHYYHTTYQFTDTNFFHNLDTTFSSSDIYCDMRMLETLAIGRCPHLTYNGNAVHQIYSHCAALYGDR